MDLKDAATIDFETLPTGERPRTRPPVPVGVAVRVDGRSRYMSWGHVNGRNNSNHGEAQRVLGRLYDSDRPLVFHNAKFDVDVAEEHMGVRQPAWDRVHDTQPMLFLRDPDAPDFQLKASAARILGIAPAERDAVEDWLMEHQPVPGVRLSTAKNSPYYVGAFIAFAPAELVEKYAVGDVDRTEKLARRVSKEILRRGMAEAYDRERRLLPVILEMERQGVRVDLERLERDCRSYARATVAIDDWLCRRLKAPPSTNWNSSDELGAALVKAKAARLGRTATGKWEVNKEALMAGILDPQVLGVLKYRAQLKTCLGTFMMPWAETARQSGGLIYTSWATTRQDRGSGTVGARTGRIQSTPNFQNLPKEFEPLFSDWVQGSSDEARAQRKSLPRLPIPGLPELPRVRGYVVPWEKGHVLIDRDYSQQEPRILAHYEDGALKEAYLADPWIDYHDNAREQLEKVLKRPLKRKPVKNINLGLIYGMGMGLLAERAGVSVVEAKQIRDGILRIYPGLREMYAEMKERARSGKPLRTWGGREHYCEPPKIVNGRLMHFDYKMTNKLIQGSAADMTKEAMIRFHNAKPEDTRLLMTVHDETLASVPEDQARERMELLRVCMESVECDVPVLSEGTWSKRSWADMKDYDKRGRLVA